MAISDRSRKALWGKSSNRCSICKKELFQSTDNEEEFNIGEECHIISAVQNGPRHKSRLDNYDSYDNLILLCRNHHREIDELAETYTEELLRYLKTSHEEWVKTTIGNAINSQESGKARFLARITSGKELMNIVAGSHGYRTDWDEVSNEEDADYIGGIFQDLMDYGDLSGMNEDYDKVKMGFQMNSILSDLEQRGYFLFAERGIERFKFGDGSLDSLNVATIVIKRKDNSEIVKGDLGGK